MKNRYYIFVHIKDLYSTAECLKRGFDPETKNLVVAKYERTNSARCLDVSPAMKRLGIKGDPRLFDIPADVKYVIAEPNMPLYYRYSAAVYEIIMRYISKNLICVISTKEMFADVTGYITDYKETAREFSEKLQSVICKELKLKADIGIATNLYLAKAAAMLLPAEISFLDNALYREKIIKSIPLSDFWFITREEAEAFANAGVYTMYDVLQKRADTSPVSKRRFKMIYECACADLPVNLNMLKLGKLRLTDKTVFPVMRTSGFQEALLNAERNVVPEVKFSLEAFEKVKAKLAVLEKGKLVNLVYYCDKSYIKRCGLISDIDTKNQSLTVVDKTLSFSDIVEIL